MILLLKEKSLEITIWLKKLEEMKKISFLTELLNSSLTKLQFLMERLEQQPLIILMMDNSINLMVEIIMMIELMLLQEMHNPICLMLTELLTLHLISDSLK